MDHSLLKQGTILVVSTVLAFTATPSAALFATAPTSPSPISLATPRQHLEVWNQGPGLVTVQATVQAKEQVKEQAKNPARVNPAIAQATVAQLLAKATKPLKQPRVYRTTVEGNYAIASWLWGEAGGQTILVQKQGRWQVLRSGGGAVDVGTLKAAGIPEKTARLLLQKNAATQDKSIDKNLRSGE